jgi:hypothetical protein
MGVPKAVEAEVGLDETTKPTSSKATKPKVSAFSLRLRVLIVNSFQAIQEEFRTRD